MALNEVYRRNHHICWYFCGSPTRSISWPTNWGCPKYPLTFKVSYINLLRKSNMHLEPYVEVCKSFWSSITLGASTWKSIYCKLNVKNEWQGCWNNAFLCWYFVHNVSMEPMNIMFCLHLLNKQIFCTHLHAQAIVHSVSGRNSVSLHLTKRSLTVSCKSQKIVCKPHGIYR